MTKPCDLIGHFCIEPEHWPAGAHRHMIDGVACRPGDDADRRQFEDRPTTGDAD